MLGLPFYRALAFTLTYTFVVTPFVLLIGLAVAVGVNNLPKMFKGPTIFFSLLPMMIHAAGGLSDPSLDGGCRRHHRGDAARTS